MYCGGCLLASLATFEAIITSVPYALASLIASARILSPCLGINCLSSSEFIFSAKSWRYSDFVSGASNWISKAITFAPA